MPAAQPEGAGCQAQSHEELADRLWAVERPEGAELGRERLRALPPAAVRSHRAGNAAFRREFHQIHTVRDIAAIQVGVLIECLGGGGAISLRCVHTFVVHTWALVHYIAYLDTDTMQLALNPTVSL